MLTPKGPIPTRDNEPLNTPFLAPLPTDASVLARNRARLDVRLDIPNNLLIDGDELREYLTDFEEQRLFVDYARGIGGGQEVGIRIGYIARNGGFLDPIVNAWHKLLGLQGGGREDLPNYRTLFRVTDEEGRYVIASDSGAGGFADTVLEYRRALTTLPEGTERTRAVASSVRALVKIPTGSSDSLLGSGAWDVGAGFALTARPDRHFAIHANGSLVYLGVPKTPNLDVRRTLFHWMIAGEYLIDGRTSLVFQSDDTPAPFRSGLSYPDRPRRQFTGGLWRQISDANRIYFAIGENDFSVFAKHAPDFTLSLGVQWRL
jgi:hypothetical protein